uniref:Uncharacterized protein n=1 Tax=Arundo donax TaxID=35708 RepID=A0A0A9DAF6_ARUDO
MSPFFWYRKEISSRNYWKYVKGRSNATVEISKRFAHLEGLRYRLMEARL